ncbi:uncharacterized protein LOC143203026 isoform X1 [Rhynchophorus ferrugineus]|uniref:uncharacterized protein LOC143203026 isoform X1 n=1 Tax=Rhynchophorus ferrugineus TaxID=354439 RepID=UPI003FCC2B40
MYRRTKTFKSVKMEQEPHNLYTDFSKDNLFDSENHNLEIVQVGLPYPISDNIALDVQDPVSDMNDKMKHYNEKLKLGKVKLSPKKLEEVSLGDGQYVTMPKQFLEFYNSCQDPGFDWKDNSNVYFNGGVLDTIITNIKRYVVYYVFSSATLNLMELDSCKNFILPYSLKTPALGVKCYNLNVPLVLVREKFTLKLLNIVNEEDHVLSYELNMNIPITDAKINESNVKYLGVIQEDKIMVKNISRNSTIFSHKLKKKCLLQIEFWDNDIIIVIDQYLVYLLNYKTKKMLKVIDPELIECNPLKTFRYVDKQLFLVSQHYVIKVGLDQDEHVSFFSHTMEKAPILCDITGKSDNTYLCLGNPFMEDKILFSGKTLYCLPYKMPNINDTLTEASMYHPDLLLIDNLRNILNASITGMKFININNKLYLYYTTSVGCVFRQEMLSRTDSESIDNLSKWAKKQKQSKDIPPPPLYITNFADMSNMFFFLKKSVTQNNLLGRNSSNKSGGNVANFIYKLNHIYGKDNIKSTLAKGFLDIWQDEEDSENYEPLIHDSSETTCYEKVNSWMNTFAKENLDVDELEQDI